MEKRTLIFISIFFITIAFIAFFTTKNISNSPQDNNLETCHTLQYNGEGKTNIIFFASEELSNKYINSLLNTPPFNEYSNEFNFYYIESTPECELYKGIAILCYSKNLIKKAGSCPNDIIVAIENRPSNIRSSAYMNVISLNENSNLNVFAHEFGHAFANLADEYTPAKIPKGSKNCQQNCDSFNQEQCFSGCSETSYFRSIQSGIMRTLSSNTFGEYNQQLILSKLSSNSIITGNLISNQADCTKSRYYLIEGEIKNNEIIEKSKTIEIGCLGENGIGPYSYKIFLEDGKTIETKEFNPEIIFTDLNEEQQISGGPEDYSGNFLLRIPVLNKAEKLEIIGENTKKEINLKDIGARPCQV